MIKKYLARKAALVDIKEARATIRTEKANREGGQELADQGAEGDETRIRPKKRRISDQEDRPKAKRPKLEANETARGTAKEKPPSELQVGAKRRSDAAHPVTATSPDIPNPSLTNENDASSRTKEPSNKKKDPTLPSQSTAQGNSHTSAANAKAAGPLDVDGASSDLRGEAKSHAEAAHIANASSSHEDDGKDIFLLTRATYLGSQYDDYAGMQLIPRRPKGRLVPKRKRAKEDPFVSSPPAAKSTSPPPAKNGTAHRKYPPKIHDGPFRTTLQTGKTTSPPSKHKASKPAPLGPTSSALAMPPPAVPVRSAQAPQYVVVSTTPSSSRTQLPPSKYKCVEEAISAGRQSIPLANKASTLSSSKGRSRETPKHVGSDVASELTASAKQAARLPRKEVPLRKDKVPAPPPPPPPPPRFTKPVTREDVFHKNETNHHQQVPLPAKQIPNVADPRKQPQAAKPHTVPQGVPDSTETSPDQQLKAPALAREAAIVVHSRKKRQVAESPVIPRIDLNNVSGMGSRRHSSIFSNGSSFRFDAGLSSRRTSKTPSVASTGNSRRRDSGVPDVEEAKLVQLGELVLQEMASRHGFDREIAIQLHDRYSDWQKVDKVLAKLSRKMNDYLNSISSDDDEEEERQQGRDEGNEEEHERQQAAEPIPIPSQQQTQSSRRRSYAPRPSLTMRPLKLDNEHFGMLNEEYSPPRQSGAGKFSRHEPERKAMLDEEVSMLTQTQGYMADGSQHAAKKGKGVNGHRRRVSRAPSLDSTVSADSGSEVEDVVLQERSKGSLRHRKRLESPGLPPSSPPASVREELREAEDSNLLEEDAEGYEMPGDQAIFFDEDNQLDGEEEMQDEHETLFGIKAAFDEEGLQDDDFNDDAAEVEASPLDYYSMFAPSDAWKHRELIRHATKVSVSDHEEMKRWEEDQDSEELKVHQGLLLQTMLHFMEAEAPEPFNLEIFI